MPSLPRRLLLDEHYPDRVAAALRDRGHDVTAAVSDNALRGASDERLLAVAMAQGRWLATENVADFRPLLRAALAAEEVPPGLLLVNARRFPRTPAGLPHLVRALDSWLTRAEGLGVEEFLA